MIRADETGAMSDEQWYWDLERLIAIPASERGPASNTLGPYETKVDAENWRSTVETRNEEWDDADEEWENDGESDGGDDD